MGSHAIKVSESTYSFLKKRARETGKSIKEVVDEMAREQDFSAYAGSWKMSEEEQKQIKKSREEMWERWEP
jgi:DUF1680 family protein